MGALSRRKGKNGELELVALARELGFRDAKRTAPMQAAGYADEFGDVSGIPIVYAEVKRYRRTPVNKFVREMPERPGLVPVLFWRDDEGAWRADLDAVELLKLIKQVNDNHTKRGQHG